MKWKIKTKDDWTAKFAFVPIHYEGMWIWLEWYDVSGWYSVPYDEQRDLRYPSQIK